MEGYRGKFAPSKHSKTRVTEIEEEIKEFEEMVKAKEEVSLTRFDQQVEPVMAKVVEAMCSQLGDSNLENSQDTPGTLGSEVSALHGRTGF